MKKAVTIKSSAHIYAFAAVWLIWALFMPMYSLWHYSIALAASIAVSFVFSKIFPNKITFIEVPDPEPEPYSSGDEQLDALVEEGEKSIREMNRLVGDIDEKFVTDKVQEIIRITRRIIDTLKENNSQYSSVRKFFYYYIPTTIKLLNSYDRLYEQGIKGENISGSMIKIENILDTLIDAYKRQLDSLFAGHALDIETDIEVLEGMLKREGLSDGDFKNVDNPIENDKE